MKLRTIAELGGTLGWLVVAFGSPLLLAMYASNAGGSELGETALIVEPVPAVQLVSLAIPKADAAEPRVSTPSAPKPPAPEASVTSTRSAVAPGPPRSQAPKSGPQGRAKPSLEAVRKGSLSAGKRGRKRPCTGDRSPDIQRGEGASWEVSRGLVNHYATHLKEFDALGYAVAHETEQGDKGMRVGGIRCDNELHQAGLRNGDVVLEVNGRQVTSWVKALWLYNTVNKQRDIVVTVLRRGEKRELTYRLI